MAQVGRYRRSPEGGATVIQINSLSDLNRAVANALHPEPPLSERRARHESGVWFWMTDLSFPTSGPKGHWESADFCTDPVASKLLRDRMHERGYGYSLARLAERSKCAARFTEGLIGVRHESYGPTEEIAMCLAALRALNVEFELVEGWDQK